MSFRYCSSVLVCQQCIYSHDLYHIPCLTLVFVASNLFEFELLDAEDPLLAAGRFLYVSRGFVVLRETSMERIDEGKGPAFGVLVLNCECLEWISITEDMDDYDSVVQAIRRRLLTTSKSQCTLRSL